MLGPLDCCWTDRCTCYISRPKYFGSQILMHDLTEKKKPISLHALFYPMFFKHWKKEEAKRFFPGLKPSVDMVKTNADM